MISTLIFCHWDIAASIEFWYCTQVFGVKAQNIRGNQIFVGPRLDLGVHVACDKLGSYCVIFVTVI